MTEHAHRGRIRQRGNGGPDSPREYQTRCKCGWDGQWWRSTNDAFDEHEEHKEERMQEDQVAQDVLDISKAMFARHGGRLPATRRLRAALQMRMERIPVVRKPPPEVFRR